MLCWILIPMDGNPFSFGPANRRPPEQKNAHHLFFKTVNQKGGVANKKRNRSPHQGGVANKGAGHRHRRRPYLWILFRNTRGAYSAVTQTRFSGRPPNPGEPLASPNRTNGKRVATAEKCFLYETWHSEKNVFGANTLFHKFRFGAVFIFASCSK